MHQHILIWRRSVPHALGANFNTGVPRIFITFADILRLKKQGQIHGYPSRVRVVRSSAEESHQSIWAGAVGSKSSKTPKK